jgi:hypothetical protein
MRTETLTQVGEEVKTRLSDTVKDLSEGFTNRCKETYDAAQRGARRVRIAAEEGLEGTRERIKTHPILFVALAASGAFALGCLAGWFAGQDRRS